MEPVQEPYSHEFLACFGTRNQGPGLNKYFTLTCIVIKKNYDVTNVPEEALCYQE